MSASPEAVPRYPLQWPLGWKRAKTRTAGTFTQTKTDVVDAPDSRHVSKRAVSVSVFVATQRLERELDRLGAADPTLSTNLQLRLDGRPRSDTEPGDPGVAVYFRFKGRATVLACDRYVRVADNIAAIAAHIDALRRIERYGVGTIEQALAGYRALPADTAADWRNVFGFNGGPVTVEQMQSRFLAMAKDKHPDKGGTNEGMAHLNRAREHALSELLGENLR